MYRSYEVALWRSVMSRDVAYHEWASSPRDKRFDLIFSGCVISKTTPKHRASVIYTQYAEPMIKPSTPFTVHCQVIALVEPWPPGVLLC